jgi:ribosomal protein S18 acetylase RimI-like enzyme
VYLAPCFDPVDGASRVKALSRGKDAAYASLADAQTGEPVAAGTAAFGHGWASVHGMRTVLSHRGQGLAGQILAAFAEAALARGLDRVFLQVEEDNPSALALYRRAGFSTAWRYHYWRKRLARAGYSPGR